MGKKTANLVAVTREAIDLVERHEEHEDALGGASDQTAAAVETDEDSDSGE